MPALNATVMVTRPGSAGEMLCEKIRAAGGEAIHFPSIVFAPPADLDLLHRQVAAIAEYDWLIFISPQAVAASVTLIKQHWVAAVRIAAVGAGTAAALIAAGLPVTVYPVDEWSSEGVLALPEFQQVAGQKIALMTGADGRDHLAQHLVARGAIVTTLIAYQRCLPTVDVTNYVKLILTNKVDVIVCTSGDGLRNTKTLLLSAWSVLQDVAVIVISEKMRLLAQELGFHKIFLAKNAGHDAIMDVLMHSNFR